MMDSAELSSLIEKFWPDEYGIVGSPVVNSLIFNFQRQSEPDIVYSKGGSDWPIIETATAIIAVCEVISLTRGFLQKGKNEDLSSIVRNVKKEISEKSVSSAPDTEKYIDQILGSQNFLQFLREEIENVTRK